MTLVFTPVAKFEQQTNMKRHIYEKITHPWPQTKCSELMDFFLLFVTYLIYPPPIPSPLPLFFHFLSFQIHELQPLLWIHQREAPTEAETLSACSCYTCTIMAYSIASQWNTQKCFANYNACWHKTVCNTTHSTFSRGLYYTTEQICFANNVNNVYHWLVTMIWF